MFLPHYTSLTCLAYLVFKFKCLMLLPYDRKHFLSMLQYSHVQISTTRFQSIASQCVAVRNIYNNTNVLKVISLIMFVFFLYFREIGTTQLHLNAHMLAYKRTVRHQEIKNTHTNRITQQNQHLSYQTTQLGGCAAAHLQLKNFCSRFVCKHSLYLSVYRSF